MDIIKLQVSFSDQVKHNTARLFFAGFSQDGQVISELIKRNLKAPVVVTNKKVYGPVLKQASLTNIQDYDGACDHDCYVISHYSKGVDATLVESASAFEASLIDTKPLEDIIEQYQSIEVVAWSFGVRLVRALCELLPKFASKISYAVALNGTVPSVDLNYGIDPKAYDTTLERFSSVMHKQFVKNMCAYAQALEIGVQSVEPPQEHELSLCSNEDRALIDTVRSLRNLDDFKCELKLMPYLELTKAQDTDPIYEPINELPSSPLIFDEAYVALGDKIIPSAAQYHYWTDYALMRLNVIASLEAPSSGPAPASATGTGPGAGASAGAGFALHTFYGPHLCPALIRDLMMCPVHKRASQYHGY